MTTATATVSLVKNQFSVMISLLARVPKFKQGEVKELHAQAIGYVWGWQDARGEHDTSVSWDFGIAYCIHAAYFALEVNSFRRPIHEAFKSWQEFGEIRRGY